MSEKFLNKYRIDSIRLKNWDYSSPGYYFITICTRDRQFYFGDVKNNKMILSDMGKIAYDCWLKIPEHFPHVTLDQFIVMPNHVHGIILIMKQGSVRVETQGVGVSVETQNFASLQKQHASLQKQNNIYKNKFGPQSKNLSSIIRGYKIGIKKWATMNNNIFHWQSRFYEKIIRDDNELGRIQNYIKNNPKKWERDQNN